MKNRIFMFVTIIALILVVPLSCRKTEHYPQKYVMTDNTWGSMLDYYIERYGISEQELAEEGGRETLLNQWTKAYENYFSVAFLDNEKIMAVMGQDIIETTYELSVDLIIISTLTGEKKVLGVLSKDKKELTLQTSEFGSKMKLYLED